MSVATIPTPARRCGGLTAGDRIAAALAQLKDSANPLHRLTLVEGMQGGSLSPADLKAWWQMFDDLRGAFGNDGGDR